MRKILYSIICAILLLFVNSSFSYAAWYNNHSVSYSHPGSEILGTINGGGPNVGTSCDSDGDTTGGSHLVHGESAVAEDNNSSSLIPHGSTPYDMSEDGNMRCLYWDEQKPENPTLLTLSAVKNNAGGDYDECNEVGGMYYCRKGGIRLTYNWSGENDQGGAGISDFQLIFQYEPEIFNAGAGWKYSTFHTGNSETIFVNGLADGIYRTWVRSRDAAGNMQTYFRRGPDVMIDTVVPTTADVVLPIPIKILAKANHSGIIAVGENGGSPIFVYYKKEDSIDESSYTSELIDESMPVDYSGWDVTQVDNFRVTGEAYREYSINFTKICDFSLNCWNGNYNINYDVYADTTSILNTGGTHYVDTATLTSGGIADGSINTMSVELKDMHGNVVIPASEIHREVDIKMSVDNTMTLNQYSNNGGSSVFLSTPADSTNYLNHFSNGIGVSKSFMNQLSVDGMYDFNFKLYSPTQDSLLLDGTGQEFTINSIEVDISDYIGGGISGVGLEGATNIDFNFAPLYTTEFVGGVADNGFIEGTVQDTQLEDDRKTGGRTSSSSRKKYLEFGKEVSGNNVSNPDYNLELNGSVNVHEGNQTDYSQLDTLLFGISGITTSLQQEDTSISTLESSYLASIISYNIDGYTVVYPGDIIGKDSYFGSVDGDNTNQVGLLVRGNTYANDQEDIFFLQAENTIKIVEGNISKALVRKNIKEELYDKVKNLPHNDGVPIHLVNSNILYYYSNNRNITLSEAILAGLGEKETLVIEGGNLIVDTNWILGSIGIVVIENENGDGGNILISDEVTNIKALIYSDKSLLPYSTTLNRVLKSDDVIANFENQLYIEGSIFSNNTIGGSRITPPATGYTCPYYIQDNDCDEQIEAQLYDLNFLRRYYRIEDVMNPGDFIPANNGTSSSGLSGNDLDYPLVIKYNPEVQLEPLPLFGG